MTLTADQALIATGRLQLLSLARALKLALETVTQYDQAIAECFHQ